MIQSAEEVNRCIAGFTEVVQLNIAANFGRASYDLEITLANTSGDTVKLSCTDISQFRVSEFGGGLTQLSGLRAADIRSRQLDRANLHFSDVECDSIAFDCSRAQAERSEKLNGTARLEGDETTA
jgi:hypothetical protein